MTEEEQEAQETQRQKAFALLTQIRKRTNPTTTEHLAETAKRKADDEIRGYAEFVGWQHLVRDQEHRSRTLNRGVRSGHDNQSARYYGVRTILDTYYRISDQLVTSLGEMTLEVLGEAIAQYEHRAANMAAEATRLERIREAMQAEGVETVAELGAERVKELYAGETSNA
jgi:hypothetical protein